MDFGSVAEARQAPGQKMVLSNLNWSQCAKQLLHAAGILVASTPQDICPLRPAPQHFGSLPPKVVVDPMLIEHQGYIDKTYLQLPMDVECP